jgi:hypothetical protein
VTQEEGKTTLRPSEDEVEQRVQLLRQLLDVSAELTCVRRAVVRFGARSQALRAEGIPPSEAHVELEQLRKELAECGTLVEKLDNKSGYLLLQLEAIEGERNGYL